MMLILTMIFYLFMLVDDCVRYQSNRYQVDRMKASLKLQQSSFIFACGYLLLYQFCYYLFPKEPILFLLILIVAINEYFRHRKPMLQQIHYTKRMIRFIFISLFFNFLIFSCLSFFHEMIQLFFIASLFIFHSYIFFLFIVLVHPLETKIRQKYVNQAKAKLNDYSGIRIGITGSYGKTSIKNILFHVLSPIYATLKTPHSYNNQMGISKTILEELKMNHEIFICEMGADHLHEIEDLADFIHPTIGIVSAIGPQHLSTFKSMENILYEKLQLLESLPKEGIGLINQDNRYLREYHYQMACKIVTVGIDYPSDYQAINIKANEFDVMIENECVHFQLQLLGKHNILNCLFAIALAHQLHVPLDCIQATLQIIQPIPHRLELKKLGKGNCIDNAYNSNPDSAFESLQVLRQMPHVRYCITPGFMDLGEEHNHYSYEFGKQLADVCDWVILIGDCVKIVEGLLEKDFDETHILHYSSMKTAIQLVSLRLKENDTVLIENDIPEIFTQ